MAQNAQQTLQIRLIYDGIGPVHWCRDPRAFGVQDKEAVLHLGTSGPKDVTTFELRFQAKPGAADMAVLSGDFAHGPPAGRFIYLGWRDVHGAFAQRLKLPLSTISWQVAEQAIASNRPLTGTLLDHHPKATSTGANIGGTRAITWQLA